MDELDELLARQQSLVAGLVFDRSEWTCTESTLVAFAKQHGEELARRHIAFAQRRFTSASKQAEELRWACRWSCSFPNSSVYALPLLIEAIRAVEKSKE